MKSLINRIFDKVRGALKNEVVNKILYGLKCLAWGILIILAWLVPVAIFILRGVASTPMRP